jgi:hypothetical protein
MGKFIISEEEKNHIRTLYEQGWVGQQNTSDYELIDKKNPFKYENLKNARKFYDKTFNWSNTTSKEGDQYYFYDKKKVDDYLSPILNSFYDKLLLNKSVRGKNDDVYVVKMTSPKLGVDQLIDSDRLFIILNLIYDKQGYGSRVSITNNEVENVQVSDVARKVNQQINKKTGLNSTEMFTNNVDVSDKLLNFLKKNLPPIKKEEIPDEFFEIRQIKKRQTDFQP